MCVYSEESKRTKSVYNIEKSNISGIISLHIPHPEELHNKEARMGAIIEWLSSPLFYWGFAALFAVGLIIAAICDERFSKEHEKFLYVSVDTTTMRLMLKVLMALAFAAFWPIMISVIALVVVIFSVLYASFFIRDFYREMTRPKIERSPYAGYSHIGIVTDKRYRR